MSCCQVRIVHQIKAMPCDADRRACELSADPAPIKTAGIRAGSPAQSRSPSLEIPHTVWICRLGKEADRAFIQGEQRYLRIRACARTRKSARIRASRRVPLLAAPFCIRLGRSSCRSADRLVQISIDSSVFQEGANEAFRTARSGQQLGELPGLPAGCPNLNATLSAVCAAKRAQHSCPWCNHNAGVDCSCHSPHSLHSRRPMSARPEPIPGLSMPRYFENALLQQTGRTRIPLLSLSNHRRSPRTPRRRRTSRGTGTCPLLVTLACFCTSVSNSNKQRMHAG